MSDPTAITMYRGDSYPIVFVLTDAATGEALDLTGAELVLTVDSKPTPMNAATRRFQVVGVIEDPATAGRVSFTPTTTHTGTRGNFFYGIELTNAAGHVRTVAKSTFTISQDIP